MSLIRRTTLRVYILAEFFHYLYQLRRFRHFDTMREPTNHSGGSQAMDEITRMNYGQLLHRVRGLGIRHVAHMKTHGDICAYMLGNRHDTNYRPHVLTAGHSQLRWQYLPLAVHTTLKLVRLAGELVLFYKGFRRKWHLTDDGYYSVWSRYVPGSRPLVVFPGLGLGAVPYVQLVSHFNRTVHLVEVPNMGHATPYSNRQFTARTVFEVVSSYGPAPDILAHSMGTATATNYLNEQEAHGSAPSPPQRVVMCDGFTHPMDMVRNHVYPFVDHVDHGSLLGQQLSSLLHRLFVTMGVHNLEFTAWAKRFHNIHDGILWRTYPNVHFLHVYGMHDHIYDVPYIRNNVQPLENERFLFQPEGKHGDCLFDQSSSSRDEIITWLQT